MGVLTLGRGQAVRFNLFFQKRIYTSILNTFNHHYLVTLNKKKTMSTKEAILNKIQILISNNFETPEKAFAFFDNDKDGKLSKKEISELLKKAEISGLIRGIVTNKLIEGYDKDGDELVNWNEFKAAVDEIKKDAN
mgnify:CR=1 FL=1